MEFCKQASTSRATSAHGVDGEARILGKPGPTISVRLQVLGLRRQRHRKLVALRHDERAGRFHGTCRDECQAHPLALGIDCTPIRPDMSKRLCTGRMCDPPVGDLNFADLMLHIRPGRSRPITVGRLARRPRHSPGVGRSCRPTQRAPVRELSSAIRATAGRPSSVPAARRAISS